MGDIYGLHPRVLKAVIETIGAHRNGFDECIYMTTNGPCEHPSWAHGDFGPKSCMWGTCPCFGLRLPEDRIRAPHDVRRLEIVKAANLRKHVLETKGLRFIR